MKRVFPLLRGPVWVIWLTLIVLVIIQQFAGGYVIPRGLLLATVALMVVLTVVMVSIASILARRENVRR